ncbi:Protein CBG12832 [Caenorhabditis briggsae]|uniref:Protein CBG12832 n=1 Tax=Caenorhabditis briggsae TaxID=6238 RepID=A8XFQ3_CAEBR|nr:Protein CBG12832 [Caenorhabditis briggsae]CAP31749.2 Protein CBG12832 [Caenorhabditis briggsae]
MPPKKTPKPGLLQFFAKQQQEKYQNNARSSDNQLDDESCQILFEKPVPSTSSVNTTPKSATKWSTTLQKSAEKRMGRDWQHPFPIKVGSAKKANGNASKSDLLANGFDGIHGNGIFYPIDEPIRNFELNLLKCTATSNCCIALPASASSSSGRICAMTVFNFLKWFPRCRILLVTASDSWLTSLRQLGLESQTTKFTTMTQFKNMKKESGRIMMCATPQCALKILESSESLEFLDEIRLVIMELKPSECCSKYKPIINALTVKDVFFRCVVLTTATSNTSRRTASITKRQIMITNLHLSDWIEQSETDFSFRNSNIPAGVEVKTWKIEENSMKLQEIIEKFESFCEKPIDELARLSILPSKSMKKMIFTCWKSMKQSNTQEIDKLETAEFLITAYKTLLIDGVVASRNYVKKEAENTKLQELAKKILDPSILGGFSEFPSKFQHLSNSIEAFLKMNNHVLGVILCRDSDQGIEIQNYLDLQLATRCTVLRIIEEGTHPARNLWNIQRISTVFLDRKAPKIVILPVKLRDFIGHSDGLPLSEVTFIASVSRDCTFNFRRFGGAYLLLANDPLEMLVFFLRKNGWNKFMNFQIRFKFEPSRLRIDVAHLPMHFFYPREMGDSLDETAGMSRLGKTHIEMSLKEHAELYKRLQNPDFSSFQRRKRPFWILKDLENPNEKRSIEVDEMDDDQVNWNQNLQYLGDIRWSKLSERFTKYLKNGHVEWAISEKRRFEYVNDMLHFPGSSSPSGSTPTKSRCQFRGFIEDVMTPTTLQNPLKIGSCSYFCPHFYTNLYIKHALLLSHTTSD